MGLCFDLGAVLEGHADVLFAVNGDVIDHCQPVGIPELRQQLPASQLVQVGFDLVLSGFPLGKQVGNFGLSALGFIEPGDQRVVAFLVFRLVEGDMCVFIDAVLDELRCDVDFRFELGKLTLKGRGVEAFHQDLLVYGYEPFFLVNHLIGGPEEQFFYFILVERRCAAFLAFKLMIALPDDFPVGVIAVPDLWSVSADAVSTLDLAGENAD